MVRPKVIRKEQVVVYQGEASFGVHVVRKGMVRTYSILASGNEVNVAIFGSGDFFPIEAIYDTAPGALFYYEALSDCEVETYSIEQFKALKAADETAPQADAKRYLGALLHVNALGQATAFEKLGHTLRYLAMRFGEPLSGKGFYRIVVKLTQQDLANLCTMSRETVSIELSKLKNQRAVIEKEKFYTVNIPLLNKIMGDESASDVQL